MSNKNKRFQKDNKSKNSKNSNMSRNSRSDRNESCGKDGEYKGSNSIQWYTQNPDLIKAAAQLPFPYVPGRKLSLDAPTIEEAPALSTSYQWEYPGIMSLPFHPTIGQSNSITDPVNIAAKELYAKVRKSFSGTLQCDAPDIMMYILAVDSLFMYIEEMKRAYYLVNAYTPMNNFMPEKILTLLGYDFENLVTNKKQLEQYIIEAIAMASKFMVPESMPLIARHQFMCANIYRDAPSTKSQLYMFKPSSMLVIRELKDTTHGWTELHPVIFAEFDKTVEDMWTYFKTSIDALSEWDTSYDILGYLQRAFEGTAFVIPSPLIPEGVLTPVYNADILLQIQNATAALVDTTSLQVTQDPNNRNILLCNPKGMIHIESNTDVRTAIPTETVLNIPGDTQPTPEQIVYATRLTTLNAGLTDGDLYSLECGTEIVEKFEFYTFGSSILRRMGSHTVVGDESAPWARLLNDVVRHAENLALFESFSYHPTLFTWYYYPNNTGDGVNTKMLISIDADNVTEVSNTFLDNLHRMCLYSEFNCFRSLK